MVWQAVSHRSILLLKQQAETQKENWTEKKLGNEKKILVHCTSSLACKDI